MRDSTAPRVRWERRVSTATAVVGLLLMANAVANAFMSVESPPRERCVGTALSLTFDDDASERCQREANAQFSAGVGMAVVFGGVVVLAVRVTDPPRRRGRRRRGSRPVPQVDPDRLRRDIDAVLDPSL